MKNKFRLIKWLIIFQFLLFSCTSLNPEPPVDVENGFVNEQINLFAPSEYNSFKTSDGVIFEVEYHSNNEIIFPNDYNVRIFKWLDNSWTELGKKSSNTSRGQHSFFTGNRWSSNFYS